MRKTQDPPLKKDESVKSSEAIESTNSENRTGVDTPDSAKAGVVPATDGGDESLDADQQRAFESIMAQIESGGLAEADLAKETGDASESQPADDGDGELEKGVREADAIDTPGPVAAQTDASDDGLDREQQQAFDSIMAQIEADDTADEATGSKEEATIEPEPEPTDDFTADPKKGDKDTAASSADEPADAQSDESTDDGLDQEQQQALESIMAQIEGESTVDTATPSGMEAGDEAELENAEGLSAELEKGGQNTDPAEHDEIRDADGDESDDGLSEDQHQAFESIMAQIEGGETDQTAPESAAVGSTDSKADETSQSPAQPSVRQTHGKTDEASEDISDDIEDILTEIASSEDASDPPDADVDDPGSVSADVKASKENMAIDDGVVSDGEDSGLEHASATTAAPADSSAKTTKSVETPLSQGPSSDRQSTKKRIPGSLKNPQKPKPLREAAQSTGSRQKKAVLASVAAIVCIALAGYLFGVPKRMLDTKTDTPDTAIRRQDVTIDIKPAPQVQDTVVPVQGESDQSRLKTAADNLDRLRNELIQKKTEIEELRAYYQAGIDAEVQEIVDRVRNTGNGTISFKSAMADPQISLGLSAIQRRDTYIKKLEIPMNILFRDSEALLFFSRKSALLALMAEKTSDIDVDGFIKQADEIREVHGSDLARLNIDAVPASPRALESIWKQIEKRLPTATPNAKINNRFTDKDNTTIWKNICQGDYSQKHKMTSLSPEAARCLVAWKGKDLFLSGLTDLSPGAARHLAAWEGDWLGLNGLKALSPEAAVHLARWKGKGLSLNGLSRLSPRVVAIMSDWQGDQIELVNVKHMAHWENPKTRLFLPEDMKHKLSTTRK